MERDAAAPDRVAVAWSGGRDSTALLHAVLQAAQSLGQVQVLALHVHHGLQRAADGWLRHCEQLAAEWHRQGLPLQFLSRRLALQLAPGDSLEARARQARYAALRDMAGEQAVREVWLAHHRRDQAETFLLQALRGAGMAGLSAMPREIERDGILWVRPWLDWPRQAVEAYVDRHALPYIDDDSNTDTRLARNRLRLHVWPALDAAFPAAETVLADSARWAQEAQACLEDLAESDLQGLQGAQGLEVRAVLALPAHRARNALRHWFRSVTQGGMPATLCERLMEELPGTTHGEWPAPGGCLRLYRGGLSWSRGGSRCGACAEGEEAKAGAGLLRLSEPGEHRLPGWRGSLHVQAAAEKGLEPSRLEAVRLAPRQGGEQFQVSPGRPARSLKKQYQALGVPAWQREGPLLWQGEQLLYVPGLGIDARAWALPGAPQLTVAWVPDRA